MQWPLISIITVTYNAEDVICNTIESVLKQTYPNIEYIIVDGMSSDRTSEFIEKYKNRGYISTYIQEKDEGIYDAMNKGIRLAKGEAILLLNAGDILYNNAIKRLVEKSTGDIKNRIICCDWLLVFPPKKFSYRRNAMFDFSKKMGVSHQGSLIGKEIYCKIGLYNIEYKYVADYDFFIRVFLSNSFVFEHVNEVLLEYMYEGTTTKSALIQYNENFELRKSYGFKNDNKLIFKCTNAFRVLTRKYLGYDVNLYVYMLLKIFKNVK